MCRYGPHQFPEKLIGKFTLLAKRRQPLPVHGAGNSTRRCRQPVPAVRHLFSNPSL